MGSQFAITNWESQIRSGYYRIEKEVHSLLGVIIEVKIRTLVSLSSFYVVRSKQLQREP